jgi:uncharacterized protein YggT (Ycf19 family)
VLVLALEACIVVLVLRGLLSWFPIDYGTSMYKVQQALTSVTEPVLGPVRRRLPPTSLPIDLSFVLVMIVLWVAVIFVQSF